MALLWHLNLLFTMKIAKEAGMALKPQPTICLAGVNLISVWDSHLQRIKLETCTRKEEPPVMWTVLTAEILINTGGFQWRTFMLFCTDKLERTRLGLSGIVLTLENSFILTLPDENIFSLSNKRQRDFDNIVCL